LIVIYKKKEGNMIETIIDRANTHSTRCRIPLNKVQL